MKYLITILFSLLSLSSLMAQHEGASDMMTADEFVEEEIKDVEWLTEKFLELGEIPQNEPFTVTFKFKNLSEDPIVITQVKPSCSCSVSKHTKTPILKGEFGEIKATYDAKREGAFFKTFMLLTNKSTSPNVLVMSGNVVTK